ncbi:hypothetical protein GCM10023310_19880 [Paenibacillus vulneris]
MEGSKAGRHLYGTMRSPRKVVHSLRSGFVYYVLNLKWKHSMAVKNPQAASVESPAGERWLVPISID